MKLTLIDKKLEANNAVTFCFESSKPISWVPGQYLEYKLTHKNQDNRGNVRWFTISSAPNEKFICITTRIFDKPSSFKKALNLMKIGDKIETKKPEGDFVIKDFDKSYVLIAGGVGITPFRSMFKQFDNDSKSFKAILLYANSDNNYVFNEELDELKDRFKNLEIRHFTSPLKIEDKDLINYENQKSKPTYYISGPTKMVKQYYETLENNGIPAERLKKDYFPGY